MISNNLLILEKQFSRNKGDNLIPGLGLFCMDLIKGLESIILFLLLLSMYVVLIPIAMVREGRFRPLRRIDDERG